MIATSVAACAAPSTTSAPGAGPGPGPGPGGSAGAPPPASGAGPRELASHSLGRIRASKWRLRNGMDVILAPDDSATAVSFMVWYRVGSRHENEAAGETGLAHLFEHLMFTQTKGSKEAGEFDRRMEEAGASTNAFTYYDYTAYVDSLPPEALELAVRLEADRMRNLELRTGQVDNEREVVREERLSSVEDSVDGQLDELLWSRSFKQHPYRWPVIGWMKDIQAVTAQKAIRFYDTYYAPNNAVAVVAGRFDEAKTLALLDATFGPLPASTTLPAEAATAGERAPAQSGRHEIKEPVPADRFVVGFPGVALGAPERAAFEVLDEILTGGPSARLYRKLVVESEVASSVRGDPAATRDPGLYALWVQMQQGQGAAKAEALIDAEIARIVREPVTEAELRRAQRRLATTLLARLSSSGGRTDLLGQYEVAGGGFARVFDLPAAYGKVTAADVLRVAQSVLAGPRTVVVAVPQ